MRINKPSRGVSVNKIEFKRFNRAFSQILFASLAAITIVAAAPAQQLHLMPLPRSVEPGQGSLPLSAHFHAGVTGTSNERLDAALTRFLWRLDRQCGHIRSMQRTAGSDPLLISVQIAASAKAIQALDEDESYKLAVTSSQATITAPNELGAMHGLETFLQLVTMDNGACSVPAVTIDDAPRFQWRGLLVDVCRHFEPVPVIERTLDGMAIAKLNVFHWHLSDDQGFRAESKKYPRLTANASSGQFYTQDQLRDVVAYARARGIRVLPEFDMPGHSSSTAFAYPELGSGEDIKELPLYGGAPNAELDPSSEKTYKYIDALVGEMGEIFPDAYFHIGGDETEGKAWLANPKIKEFMDKKGFKTPTDLQSYFNQRMLPILTKHNKKMVGWDEIFNPSLPKDIMVHSWRGVESLSQAAQQGYTGILSAPYYLDHQKTSQQMFLDDVIPADTTLTPDQQKLIFGGEITMWAEQINAETIDSRIWPRSMAVAERFWSPQSDRDVADMYRRLRFASLELEDVGLTHRSGPQKLRRNVFGSMHPDALDTFASILEPVSFGDREDTQHTDSYTSLDRLVDMVVADPPARQDFNRDVAEFLEHGPGYAGEQRLRQRFESWQQAAPLMQALAARNARLSDAADRARQLGQLAECGLESLSYMDQHVKAPASWSDAKKATITDADKPSALVKFVFLPALQKLVEAASAQNQ